MKHLSPHVTKANDALREALREAGSQDRLRAVLVLELPEVQETALAHAGGEPPTRSELIERRRAAVAEAAGPTLEALRELGLEVRGGELLRGVLVTGAAASVLKSLALEGVRRAMLDQEITAR